MTIPSITPRQTDVLTALRGFLLSVLPAGTEIVRGQDNRVAGPQGPDYVVMTPIMVNRLETNVDLYADCAFQASISGTTLNVSQMLHGSITIGNQLFGSGVSSTIYITGTLSGAGGSVGTYQLSGTLGTFVPQVFAGGVLFAMQPAEMCVQIDCYGPNSFDNVMMISTLFRDDVAIETFASFDVPAPPNWADIPVGGTLSVPYNGIRPLFADNPVQLSQIFGEQQFEIRWKLEAYLQVNSIVVAGQEFFSTAHIKPIPVDLFFP
jgi:hypothetical protein